MVDALESALWVEKYRPKTLPKIHNQEGIVNRLKRFVETKTIPHCLFVGPPGTGKTTAALCLAHDMFGANFHEAFMELNASDARGIDVIRTTVKQFARMASISGLPFKILVLDEADNMTNDAQHAMRRTMERYTQTCRFILCANYPGRIIEPIQSRCAVFRFTSFEAKLLEEYMIMIAEKETVTLKKSGIHAIISVANGDLRKTLNLLQAAASMEKPVDEEAVYSVLGVVKPQDVNVLIETAFAGKINETQKMLRTFLFEQGIAGADLLKQLYKTMLSMDLPAGLQVAIADSVGEVDYRISQGADEEVQLIALLAKLSSLKGSSS